MPRKKVGNSLNTCAGSGLPVLCQNIRFFREKRGMEQKELATRVGVSANAVSNWENGRSRPDIDLLPGLCGALEATLYDLLGTDAPAARFTAQEEALILQYRTLSAGHRQAVDGLLEALLAAQAAEQKKPPVRELICYGRPLAAGIGDPSEFDDAGRPILLYASKLVDRADCVFTVNGDSMEPAYHSGDRVLVARIPGAPPLQYGEVGAFIAGNETYIKICEKDGLHSFNPAYAPLPFGEGTDVFLIGRVIGVLDPEQIVPEADAAGCTARR